MQWTQRSGSSDAASDRSQRGPNDQVSLQVNLFIVCKRLCFCVSEFGGNQRLLYRRNHFMVRVRTRQHTRIAIRMCSRGEHSKMARFVSKVQSITGEIDLFRTSMCKSWPKRSRKDTVWPVTIRLSENTSSSSPQYSHGKITIMVQQATFYTLECIF
jgi:hypothetical protein